jgi:hypothetical protein
MTMRRRWILALPAVLAYGLASPAAQAVGEPENTSPPQVSGQPVVGSTLSTSDGTWSSILPITGYSYQWVRCTPACADIPGATSNSYTVTEVDRGTTIKSRVTATNSAGSSSAESAPVGPVSGGSGVLAPAPTWSRAPLISPFPSIRARASGRRGGAALGLITIRAMPGATAFVSCSGRGCPYPFMTHFLRVGRMRIVSLKQRYGAGAVIELRISHPSATGKYVRLDVGRGSVRRTDGCVYPGSPQPRTCEG